MVAILRVVHIVTGVIGSIVILLMAITGLLLNHQALLGYSTATQLRVQKLIVGLHTGTYGNVSFVWLTDFGAICMMVLSVTGLWMFFGFFIRKVIRKGEHR